MWIVPREILLAALFAAPLALAAGAAFAGEWDFSGSLSAEARIFPNDPAFANQDDSTVSPSISLESELVYEWNDGDDRFTLVPFLRWDGDDGNRSHGDLREAAWLHLADDWDLVVGLDRAFWGVAESRHLVDIINQYDAVEDIDNEDKLGQPMVNLNLQRDWGSVSGFLLPGFRRRTFPDGDARLGGGVPVDDDDPTFDSGAEERHVDLALRWAHSVGNWDIGLAHFHGTSREPRLLPRAAPDGAITLVPHYDQIDQTGVDVQLTKGAWLWKLEAITRGGHGERFAATVGGFEYTRFQVFESAADLGLLAEYHYDGRDQARAPRTLFDDDLFIGGRLTLNDEQDSALLAGTVIDRTSQATLVSLEAERRLGEHWRLELEGRLFLNQPSGDPAFAIRDDDVVTLRLTRYF